MKKRYLIIVLIIIVYGVYQGFEYYNNHYNNERIWKNILKREDYSISRKGKETIHLFIKPEWIPFDTKKPQQLNIKLEESNNTIIVLREIWNRGNDIYFSFHTTYNLGSQSGTFLHNMLINDDGTFTSAGSPNDFQLIDPNHNRIIIGQTGYGPESDFSFGINPEEYDKIQNGFYVDYSGMNLYSYSRK